MVTFEEAKAAQELVQDYLSLGISKSYDGEYIISVVLPTTINGVKLTLRQSGLDNAHAKMLGGTI